MLLVTNCLNRVRFSANAVNYLFVITLDLFLRLDVHCLIRSYETSLLVKRHKHKNCLSPTSSVAVRNVRAYKGRFIRGYAHGPLTVMEQILCLSKMHVFLTVLCLERDL
jgi:hypothetical protein